MRTQFVHATCDDSAPTTVAAERTVAHIALRLSDPVALQALQSLCSKVTGRDFVVDNPYLFKTKTEVVAGLKTHQAAHLIPYTCSCAHSMFKSKTQWHCGSCSQCIDRRVAIIAAGLSANDPEADYATDVFRGARKDGPEKSMAVDYARHGIELSVRSESELTMRFNAELSRAVRFEPKRSEAAEKIVAMHKRHGDVVSRVLREQIAEHAENLIEGTLDNSSLLALVVGKQHLADQSHRVATRLVKESGAAISQDPITTDLETLRVILPSILAKFEVTQRRAPKKAKLPKRDAVIFAAILLGLKGPKYCVFLHERQVKPKWCDSDSRAESYLKSYNAGDPWRKKVQDEKTRAKSRMDRYTDSELSIAFNTFVPDRLDTLRHRLSIRTVPLKRGTLPFA